MEWNALHKKKKNKNYQNNDILFGLLVVLLIDQVYIGSAI